MGVGEERERVVEEGSGGRRERRGNVWEGRWGRGRGLEGVEMSER